MSLLQLSIIVILIYVGYQAVRMLVNLLAPVPYMRKEIVTLSNRVHTYRMLLRQYHQSAIPMNIILGLTLAFYIFIIITLFRVLIKLNTLGINS